MKTRELQLYDDVILLTSVRTDQGSELAPRSKGHVVDVPGPGEFVVEFAIEDSSLVGGERVETCLVRAEQVMSAAPQRPYPVTKREHHALTSLGVK